MEIKKPHISTIWSGVYTCHYSLRQFTTSTHLLKHYPSIIYLSGPKTKISWLIFQIRGFKISVGIVHHMQTCCCVIFEIWAIQPTEPFTFRLLNFQPFIGLSMFLYASSYEFNFIKELFSIFFVIIFWVKGWLQVTTMS